jgi:hypothetical protein
MAAEAKVMFRVPSRELVFLVFNNSLGDWLSFLAGTCCGGRSGTAFRKYSCSCVACCL